MSLLKTKLICGVGILLYATFSFATPSLSSLPTEITSKNVKYSISSTFGDGSDQTQITTTITNKTTGVVVYTVETIKQACVGGSSFNCTMPTGGACTGAQPYNSCSSTGGSCSCNGVSGGSCSPANYVCPACPMGYKYTYSNLGTVVNTVIKNKGGSYAIQMTDANAGCMNTPNKICACGKVTPGP